MRILFLGLNYAPENIGIAVYSAGLCESLARQGHDVRVVAAKPYYPQWARWPGHGRGWRRTREHGVDVLRCPLYVPARPTGLRRILHHLSFAASAIVGVVRMGRGFRPDIVLTVTPSLIAAPVAAATARAIGARSWVHVQDFEVGAAFATGLIRASGWKARLAQAIERHILSLFDVASSISPEMCAKLGKIGIPAQRIVEFRNWAEIDRIRPLTTPSDYRCLWNVRAAHVALYSGNIANKQGLEIVIEAARRLQHRRDLLFIVCGQGPNRASLERQAAGLDNICFHDLQPRDKLEQLMGLASVHLLPQKASAADLVLPSKLTNMLASGRPLVATAEQGTGLFREVEGCGLIVPPEDGQSFAEAIEYLIDDSLTRARIGEAARRRAEERWNQDRIVGAVSSRMEHEAVQAEATLATTQ